VLLRDINGCSHGVWVDPLQHAHLGVTLLQSSTTCTPAVHQQPG
jgi:hypothetical protein